MRWHGSKTGKHCVSGQEWGSNRGRDMPRDGPSILFELWSCQGVMSGHEKELSPGKVLVVDNIIKPVGCEGDEYDDGG